MSRLQRTGTMATAAVLAGIFGVGAVPTTSPAAVVSDTFTVGDGSGTAGTDLNGTLTEVGSAAWVAHDSIDFTANNTIKIAGAITRVAAVPFAVNASDTLLTVSGMINPDDSATPGAFVGIGFTDNTDQGAFWSSGGSELWMWISDNGGYQVLAGGTFVEIKNSHAANTAPGFVANGFNKLEIKYDKTLNQVTALINDVAVVSNYDLDTSYKTYTPNIGGAGLFFYSNNGEVDNFNVTSVPEPATGLGMIGASALGLLAARRRRRA